MPQTPSQRLIPCLGVVAIALLPGNATGLTVETVRSGVMTYTVASVDLARDQLRLHWLNPTTQAPYRTFGQLRERLRKEGQTLLFATNSGIYTPEWAPLGLHVENGRTVVRVNQARSAGNFALLPNGVFWLAGKRAGVTETQAFLKSGRPVEYATQSGPLLVQAGRLHPAFRKTGTSFKSRSGVGVCADGRVKFALSAGPVNFYTFALFFRDALRCPDALYLDGSISAYATPTQNTQLVDFAGMWSVTTRR